MIAIIDFGSGNLRSVQKAFERVGVKAVVTSDASLIRSADKVVLPGVGAMKAAMDKLAELNLIGVTREVIAGGKPFLGICLGLQLLFETSDEGGKVQGLGVLKGRVKRFNALKVPHMGWNELSLRQRECPLFKDIPPAAHVYFCHSFYIQPADDNVVAATTDYGVDFVSAIAFKNIYGVQFHPEKSQTTGLAMMKNFVEAPPCK